MSVVDAVYQEVEQDLWNWIHDFVTAKNEFYGMKFAPCPFAQKAVVNKTVDVLVWQSGNVRDFIRAGAERVRDIEKLTTLVMAFPPKTRHAWGLSDYVEGLNMEYISSNVFLNTGVAKSTSSRYPGSNPKDPYFIVIANSLDGVLAGAEALAKTNYYKDWPAEHYALVVERRARLAKQYGIKPNEDAIS